MASRRDMVEAAALLRRVLEFVERGELDVGPGHGQAMLRRIEGAVIALESAGR